MDGDLRFALALADAADALTLGRFRAADLRVETKADLTPVTDADRAVERALRELVASARPDDGVLGEEEGDDGGKTRWIVDPIDGTSSYARGSPAWATLLAYEREGAVVCGVVSAPALGRRWWALAGGGAFADGRPARVSAVAALEDAAVACARPDDLARLERRAGHGQSIGDFLQHMLVAEGELDAAVDQHLAIWDYAAVALVVDEAGGRTSSPDGAPPRPGEQLVSTNRLLHDAVLAALTGS